MKQAVAVVAVPNCALFAGPVTSTQQLHLQPGLVKQFKVKDALQEEDLLKWSTGMLSPRKVSIAAGIRMERASQAAVSEKVPSTAPAAGTPENGLVVGCGGAGVDYLASVASYPKPDDKIRTTDLQVQGGGNVGNALTAAARLGLTPRIVTKVADDSLGNQILSELREEGIDTSHVVVAEGGVSPFTYIIVDAESKTRTCIHTAGSPPITASELPPDAVSAALQGAHLAYFDGRLSECAVLLAREAAKRSIPILVDAERPREGLDELLGLADYVVASSRFPLLWTGASSLGAAQVAIMSRLPKAKFLIVTLGSEGCAVLVRATSGTQSKAVPVDDVLRTLQQDVLQQAEQPFVVSSGVTSYVSSDGTQVDGRLLVGSAVPLTSPEVVDTTGAGDAFIGAVLYGLCAGLPLERILPLAATVAAAKCQALGARPGLPQRSDRRVASLL